MEADKPSLDSNVAGDHLWPKGMIELMEVLIGAAMREGVCKHESEAQRLARWAVATLGNYFGGRQFYLPSGKRLQAALKGAQIWNEFTGDNVDELAMRHRLSSVRIRAILKEQRLLRKARATS